MTSPLPALGPMVPLIVSAGLGGSRAYLPRRLTDAVATATAAAMLGVCVALIFASARRPIVYWFGGWHPLPHHVAIGISFTVDPLGAGMAALACALVLCAFVYSWRYFVEVGTLFHALMLAFLAAMIGFCFTGDIFNLFVWFELMSVCGFCLAGYKVEERGPIQGALNFAITNTVGAYMMLLGIGLLYGRTGALNLAQMGAALQHRPMSGLELVALLLLLAGLFTKAAIVPFHFWLADAHAVAPSPVCVIFSGVMVELGLFGFWRIYETVFATPMQAHAAGLRTLLVVAGCVTALLGALMCFYQHHLKRMLAFSTISHSGLFLMGLAAMTPLGLAGSAVYVLAHAGVKSGLFLCVGILLHRWRTVDELDLGGKGRKLPLVGVIYLLGGLALAGLPPFGTFLGGSIVAAALQQTGFGWADLVILASTALVGAAVLRTGLHVFLGWGGTIHSPFYSPRLGRDDEAEIKGPPQRTPVMMLLPTVVLVLVGLAVGLVPHLPQDVLQAARVFDSRTIYQAAVFGARVRAAAAGSAPPATNPWDYAKALVAVAGALGLAVVSLQRSRLPQFTSRLRSILHRTVEHFRLLQSGQVGDYVTWIIAGFVAFAASAAAAVR